MNKFVNICSRSFLSFSFFLLVASSIQGCKPVAITDGIRIIDNFPPGSNGLKQDAKIFRQAFEENGILASTEMAPLGVSYINLFLENITPEHLSSAKINWLMVNQEWLSSLSVFHLDRIDLVICKTRHAVDLMKKLRKEHGLTYNILYTKFTSMVDFDDSSKDFQVFLHSPQKSNMKNTGSVIECWKRNPRFPKLQGSCIGMCRKEQIIAKGHTNLDAFQNIELIDQLMPWSDYKSLRAQAGVFVVPSAAEGYGHYINEARANGSIVVTTDAPPMNELVEDNISGFLVKTNGEQTFNSFTGAKTYSIDPDELAKVIQNILDQPVDRLMQIAASGRDKFIEDTRFFKERIAQISTHLKSTGDVERNSGKGFIDSSLDIFE